MTKTTASLSDITGILSSYMSAIGVAAIAAIVGNYVMKQIPPKNSYGQR